MRGIPVQVADYPFFMLHFVLWKNRAKFAIIIKTRGCVVVLGLNSQLLFLCTTPGRQNGAIGCGGATELSSTKQ
jgi:hypothetical protein